MIYRARIYMYQGYRGQEIPSTTIAGGIVYGMYLNGDEREFDIYFSNFKLKRPGGMGGVVPKAAHLDLYRSRVSLHRVANISQPFLGLRVIEKGAYYAIYEGYVGGDREKIESITSRYGIYIGDMFSMALLEIVGEYSSESNDLCVYNLPLNENNIESFMDKLSREGIRMIRVAIQRFYGANYTQPLRDIYTYYPDLEAFKGDSVEIAGQKHIYLVTFKLLSDRNNYGKRYYNESALNNVDNKFTRNYLRMGFGGILPCL